MPDKYGLTRDELRAETRKNERMLADAKRERSVTIAKLKASAEARAEMIYATMIAPHEEAFAAEDGVKVGDYRAKTIAGLIPDDIRDLNDDDGPVTSSELETESVKAFRAAIGRK